MTLILFLFLLSFTFEEYILYRINKDIFSPINITMGVWIFIIGFFLLLPNLLSPLNGTFILSVFLWTQGFVFGALPFSQSNRLKLINNSSSLNVTIFNSLVILSVVASPLFFLKILDAIGDNYINFFVALRVNSNSGLGFEELGPLLYVKILNSALLIVAFWESKHIKRTFIIYLVVVNLLMGLSIMEKGSFFLILIAGLYVLKEKNIISLKHLVFGLLFFLVASYIFNGLRRGDNPDEGFLNFFSIYVMSPSVAYETLKPLVSEEFGASTFPFFYKLVNTLFGTSFITVEKLKDPVFVPVLTNVFTVMQPFYEDFGYIGVFLFGFIYGIISGCFYFKKNSSKIFRCLYTYLLTLLMLQFFQENLFVSFSVLIQYTIIWYICYNFTFKKNVLHRNSDI